MSFEEAKQSNIVGKQIGIVRKDSYPNFEECKVTVEYESDTNFSDTSSFEKTIVHEHISPIAEN